MVVLYTLFLLSCVNCQEIGIPVEGTGIVVDVWIQEMEEIISDSYVQFL